MSSKVFFTSDLHLGHTGIITHCHRPFDSTAEMDELVIANINASVGYGDRLYVIGDFSLKTFKHVCEYRKRIKCASVFLLRGNHDSLSDGQYDAAGFIFKGDLAEIKVEEQRIVLCHYAMRSWHKQHKGAWQLFGHSHGNLPDDPKLLSFDVGVDCWNWQPLEYSDIERIMQERIERGAASVAHHGMLNAI